MRRGAWLVVSVVVVGAVCPVGGSVGRADSSVTPRSRRAGAGLSAQGDLTSASDKLTDAQARRALAEAERLRRAAAATVLASPDAVARRRDLMLAAMDAYDRVMRLASPRWSRAARDGMRRVYDDLEQAMRDSATACPDAIRARYGDEGCAIYREVVERQTRPFAPAAATGPVAKPPEAAARSEPVKEMQEGDGLDRLERSTDRPHAR